MKLKALLFTSVISLFTIITNAQTVTDFEGNTYNTVTIGTQIWMQENLKTKTYNDGVTIPLVTNANTWATTTSGAYCNNNHMVSNGNIYGHLYNFYAATDSHKICPTGWHVPDREEWEALFNYLGADSAAGKMKTTTGDWRLPNVGATNESGFTALPGGQRNSLGSVFVSIGVEACFWRSTSYSEDMAYEVELHDNSTENQGGVIFKSTGNSIRCIKDEIVSVKTKINTDKIVLYPNPAYNNLFLKNIKENSSIEIYNHQGMVLMQYQLSKEQNQIDISSLSKGLYTIKIQNIKKSLTHNFIKN